MDDRAQVSAELIVIIAAVLAVALILVQKLGENAHRSASVLEDKYDDLEKAINKIG